MGAKNWVLEGDYKHKAVIMQGGKAVLNVGLMKNLKLDSSTIDQIEVVDEDSQKSMGSAVARGAAGAGRRGGRDREDEGGSCGGDSVQGREAVPSGTGRHTVQGDQTRDVLKKEKTPRGSSPGRLSI
jgi:hypothetical protein